MSNTIEDLLFVPDEAIEFPEIDNDRSESVSSLDLKNLSVDSVVRIETATRGIVYTIKIIKEDETKSPKLKIWLRKKLPGFIGPLEALGTMNSKIGVLDVGVETAFPYFAYSLDEKLQPFRERWLTSVTGLLLYKPQ